MGILVMAAFSGIFTLIALLSTNKAVSSTLCILGFFLLVIATVYVNERLSAPEMIGGAYELTEEGEVRLCDPYPNPGYVEGATRDFFQFVIDFLPTGQGFQMSEAGTEKGMELRPVLYLYSSMIAAATTVLGIVIFRKKDLK